MKEIIISPNDFPGTCKGIEYPAWVLGRLFAAGFRFELTGEIDTPIGCLVRLLPPFETEIMLDGTIRVRQGGAHG